MRTFLASAFRITVAAGIAVAAYLVITFISIWSVGQQTVTSSADVIVVMGAAQYDGTPSAMLEGRLRNALELYRAGRATVIAVTGGKQEGDRFTEAATSRRWLTDNGVPKSAIIEENKGRSTWESLENLAPMLRDKSLQTVIVSTSRWHAQRSVLTLRELGITAMPSGTSGTMGWSAYVGDGSDARVKYLKETVGVSLGRLISFQALFEITG